MQCQGPGISGRSALPWRPPPADSQVVTDPQEQPLARAQAAQHRGRIVVGVDGSSASLNALEWAVGQASLTGAVVEAVTAWHVPATYGGYPIVAQIDWESDAQSIQDNAVEEALGDDATAVVRRVAHGHPVGVLLEASADAEMLVVGSRGHGGFTGMLLGSVSEHVVARAPCAVVVIKSPGGEARALSAPRHDDVAHG
jgi:nucleotide-binding universal stress UspA family protein